MAGLDDKQSLARLRAGDGEAFDALIERYHGRLERLAALFMSLVEPLWHALHASAVTGPKRSLKYHEPRHHRVLVRTAPATQTKPPRMKPSVGHPT